MTEAFKRAVESRQKLSHDMVNLKTKDIVEDSKNKINFQIGEVSAKIENISTIICTIVDMLDCETINCKKVKKDLTDYAKNKILDSISSNLKKDC